MNAADIMTIPQIDLVFTYVDGDDPAHAARLTQTRRALGELAGEAALPKIQPTWYHNVSELTYSVRSALRFLPWIRTIFIVTDRQNPPVDAELLDSGKVRVVDHAEIIPESCRPVFDSTIIESFLYRIDGLSEVFLYNNDDMMFGRPIGPEEFVTSGPDGDVRLRLMTQPGILRAGIAAASAMSPPFLPRANTFTAGISNACRLLRERAGLAWQEIVYPRHFTYICRIATARRIEEELGDALAAARGKHLRCHRQIAWLPLAYSLEARWHGAERRKTAREDRLFLDFARFRSPRSVARAWQRLAQSQAKFLCFNNIRADQADRFAQVMALRGLGDPPSSGV